VLLMAGIGLFGLLDANSKLLSGEYAAAQALWVRHATLLVLLLGLRLAWTGAGGKLRTAHPALHAGRAVAMLCSGVLFFQAFRALPLADGYLVFFTAPFPHAHLRARLPGRGGAARGLAVVGGGVRRRAAGAAAAAGWRRQRLGLPLRRAGHAVLRGQHHHQPPPEGRERRGAAAVLALVAWARGHGAFAWTHWVPPTPAEAAAMVANGLLAAAPP
jgi:hypothetical protein